MRQMGRSGKVKQNNSKKQGRRIAAASVILLMLVCAFLIYSDVPFVRSARDSLLGKLGYVSEDVSDNGSASGGQFAAEPGSEEGETGNAASLDAGSLPEYDGHHYVTVNGNVPLFPDEVYSRASLVNDGGRLKTEGSLPGVVSKSILAPYEYYGDLDGLGRCTGAYGCLGEETMPAEGQERGEISDVHPSGWASGQKWERAHLIAWVLSAENANAENLITGTHYLNYDGMRPFEEKVADYIWHTGNHVLYMSVPWFAVDELVPRGVQMTARSVEDGGKGISFNVYCFNVTPGASIDYRTGIVTTKEQAALEPMRYVVNRRSGVFHYPDCDGAKSMSPHNREEVTATRTELTEKGYTPCGSCRP